jgi:hypothetical protein
MRFQKSRLADQDYTSKETGRIARVAEQLPRGRSRDHRIPTRKISRTGRIASDDYLSKGGEHHMLPFITPSTASTCRFFYSYEAEWVFLLNSLFLSFLMLTLLLCETYAAANRRKPEIENVEDNPNFCDSEDLPPLECGGKIGNRLRNSPRRRPRL